MIIVEGPDGCGKSTLCNYLSNRLGVKKFHAGGPPKTEEETCDRMLHYHHLFTQATPLIFDRVTFISEVVYGPIVRGQNLLRTCGGSVTTENLMAFRPLIIYCWVGDRLQEKNLTRVQDKKLYKTTNHINDVEENIREINHRYESIMSSYVHLKYCYPVMSISHLAYHCESHLRGVHHNG